MVGLGIAYVGAWGLSSRFERYPFINQLSTARASLFFPSVLFCTHFRSLRFVTWLLLPDWQALRGIWGTSS
jgi:hypothetical protein